MLTFVSVSFAQLHNDEVVGWVSDEKAREVASAAVHSIYPEPCYSTYRQEHIEGLLTSLYKNPIVGTQINQSLYFYRVASDSCDYFVEENGKKVLRMQVSMDCCEYGIVAVDRGTRRAYWFANRKERPTLFKELVRDAQLRPDFPEPSLFLSLYRDLVWGDNQDTEITSSEQLRKLVQQNFRSAYSPYERDKVWERKFNDWWHRFNIRVKNLKLETTFQMTDAGTTVRGYGFSGFQLTVPRSHPPPKGTPKLFQWSLLLKTDGTVEEQRSKVVYSSR